MRMIRFAELGVIVVAAQSIIAAHAVAQGAKTSLPDATVKAIDAVYARYASPAAPGCVVGVFQNGRITFENGYGSANIEYGVPITPTTPFIMGSVSKQFTAAAIALLVEQGKIKLDDDVRKYVPELSDYGKRITIDHLVHHTTGLRDWWSLIDASGARKDDGYSVDDVLQLAARQKHLNFDPGDEYNYSNTGYIVLGIIVQRVSGLSLRQFADQQIFKPLGMTVSHYHDDHNEPVKGRAFAYSPIAGGRWTIDVWNNDIVGQGGVMTTLEELQKWDENFYTGQVGGKGFLARQLQQGVLNDGTKLAYAFGLEVVTYRGLPLVEHNGSTGGYRTDISRFPAQHTSVATMCNLSTADATRLAHGVADAVLADRFTQPVPPAPTRTAAQQSASSVTLSDAELTPLTGMFYSSELDAKYELTRGGGGLLLRRAHGLDTLRALDARTFRGGGVVLRFAADASTSPAFTVENGRARAIEFERMPARSGSK
jgi:CubicO group peptidase (beta-lactamase class C family)